MSTDDKLDALKDAVLHLIDLTNTAYNRRSADHALAIFRAFDDAPGSRDVS